MQPQQARPLEGIRVVDYSHFLAGPYVGRCLAALGAEVIKVERPGAGDAGRHHPYAIGGRSGYFLQLNMGKKGLSVNTKDPRGRARVQLGGLTGKTFDFEPGDVAVLPAGTGHQRLSGSADLLVIGAYPPDGTYNLCRGDNPADRDKALATIAKVPVPAGDPVLGRNGGLPKLWRG